jgi:N-acetylglutamate synthase-like GNAT family acetyltransferase
VHPDHARKGLGRKLIEHVASWARDRDLDALTLTTYVDVPWNGPYYERLGFRFLTADEETPRLRAIRAHERTLGLEVWPRTSMRRSLRAD